jgi:hypothetical protein
MAEKEVAAMANREDSPEMKEARRVDALRDRVPTTEQSARESAGNVRRPPDGKPSMIGVTDTPNAAPPHTQNEQHVHDFTHRGDHKIQGEDIETSGSQSADRKPDLTHL